jgi:hypothetical protein
MWLEAPLEMRVQFESLAARIEAVASSGPLF